MNEAYRYFGLISVFLLTIGLITVVTKWPKGIDATFSQHVAQRKSSIMYYQILFLVVLPLLLVYMLGWLGPTYNLGKWFSAFIVGSAIFQVACTFVPETGGTKTKIHRILAFMSADLLLPVVVIMTVNRELPSNARITSAICLALMLFIVGILIPRKGYHQKILILQSLYFTLFFIAILTPAF